MTPATDEPIFSIGTASRLTGIPADTLRAWERRYNAVTPRRCPDNNRRGYTRSDLARLGLIKQLVDQGHAVSSVVYLPEDALRERMRVHSDLQADTPEPRPEPPSAPRVLVFGDGLPFQVDGWGAGLPGLERMLRTYPNVNFVGHANGWGASISADMTDDMMNAYPKTPVVPGGAADRLLTQYPNMYADLSAGSGHNAIARDLPHGRLFLERHREKLFFATDYLMPGQEVPQFDLFKSLDLAKDTWDLISHRNAQKFLKL